MGDLEQLPVWNSLTRNPSSAPWRPPIELQTQYENQDALAFAMNDDKEEPQSPIKRPKISMIEKRLHICETCWVSFVAGRGTPCCPYCDEGLPTQDQLDSPTKRLTNENNQKNDKSKQKKSIRMKKNNNN